jgi:acyl-CoA reductase-like NAD-dependent aldehyde dehydrogenase
MADTLLPEGVTLAHPDKLFIGGQWVAPRDGGTIEIVSPNSEQVVAFVAEAGEADMDDAVAAARAAFDRGPWPTMKPAERAAKMQVMLDWLKARHGEMALCQTAQMGALSTMAPFLVAGGSDTLERTIGYAGEFEWVKRRETSVPGKSAFVAYEPVGVVACIAPWNVPYSTMMGKVAPALITGCTIIMKPSPETPLEAYFIAEAAEAAGIPAGVVNLVPSHRDAADYLVRRPGVDKISFTGSTAAGRRIASVAGDRIARVTLELGGKSAAIVRDDMPTDIAAKMLGRTITMLSGQICATLSRAIVPAARHDEIAEAIAAEMKLVKIGYSDDAATEMGPLAMKRQLERVEGYIAKGKEEGAELVTGGRRPSHLNHGFFIEPTLFANVDNKSAIAQEEIFGPVLSLIKADDEEHAIALANDTIYGLNNSVLTQDADAAYRIARQLRSGGFNQNGLGADFALPFGGFKQSGIGREGGLEGLHAYLETKTMLLDAEPASL